MELTPEKHLYDINVEEGDDENAKERMSCCYRAMVFTGLALSLFGVSFVIIYAGFWTNFAMHEHGLLVLVGGTIDNIPQDSVSVLVLPDAKSNCKSAPPYPMAVTGAVGVVMTSGLLICGGLTTGVPEKNEHNRSMAVQDWSMTVQDCFRLDPSGWNKVGELKHSRAFSAGAFFPGRGWWITGGISLGSSGVLGLENPLTSTELIPIENYERGEEYKFLVDEPNLPSETGLSHHCLVRLDKYRVLMIGGQTNGNNYMSEVWLFDWKKRKWDKWTDLRYGRHSHACSIALDNDFVVVAGGESEHELVHGGGSQLAEIMELTTGFWHIMPHLPKPVWGGSLVHVNGMPTLIGGSMSEESTTIQLLDKGEFKSNKLIFRPDISPDHMRKHAVSIVAQEKFVCY